MFRWGGEYLAGPRAADAVNESFGVSRRRNLPISRHHARQNTIAGLGFGDVLRRVILFYVNHCDSSKEL
jgi:hypothetical protein